MSSELTTAQKGALLMARLLLHGPLRAEREAQRMDVSRSTIYSLLNALSALHEVPIVNDRGWWYVQFLDDTEFERARYLLATLRAELEATPAGTAFCRPLKRAEIALLARLLEGLTQAEPQAEHA